MICGCLYFWDPINPKCTKFRIMLSLGISKWLDAIQPANSRLAPGRLLLTELKQRVWPVPMINTWTWKHAVGIESSHAVFSKFFQEFLRALERDLGLQCTYHSKIDGKIIYFSRIIAAPDSVCCPGLVAQPSHPSKPVVSHLNEVFQPLNVTTKHIWTDLTMIQEYRVVKQTWWHSESLWDQRRFVKLSQTWGIIHTQVANNSKSVLRFPDAE